METWILIGLCFSTGWMVRSIIDDLIFRWAEKKADELKQRKLAEYRDAIKNLNSTEHLCS